MVSFYSIVAFCKLYISVTTFKLKTGIPKGVVIAKV